MQQERDVQLWQKVLERFRGSAYKMTPQRRTILRVFLNHGEQHLSAEEVYAMVRREDAMVGLATVYRTLEILADLDILERMDFGDGKTRWELSDRDQHHHHHLICLNCGAVSEFGEDFLEGLEETVESRTGFRISNHQLKFFGTCPKCQKQAASDHGLIP